MMNDCSADEVVANMEKGICNFRVYDEDSQTDESSVWLLKNHCAKNTEGGE